MPEDAATSRRILLLNTLMEAGGAQKAMLQLAAGLHDRGHDVRVATMYDKDAFVPRFEQRFGLPIVNLQMRSTTGGKVSKAAAAARGLGRLRSQLRDQRTQVLQTFSHYSNLLGPLVARSAAVPVCVTSQRMRLAGRSSWLLRGDRWTSRLNLAQRMVAVSESVRGYCIEDEGLAPDRVVTIPNGLDVNHWDAQRKAAEDAAVVRASLGLGAEHRVVTTVARLHPQKGYEHLLQAAAALAESHPQVRFLWVGAGELRAELGERLREARLDEHVRLLGARSDVPALLAASDLFVLPSLWEGMPNAVLEAMAASLPVVTTAVDGTVEVVEPGQTGWLVPPGDSEALREAIDTALRDPASAAAMGAAGRQRVEQHFGLKQYIDRFEQLYERLIHDASGNGKP